MAEFLVQVLADPGAFFAVGVQELEGVDLHHHREVRHFFYLKALPDDIVNEQDARLGMVDKIVYIAGFEFVQDGNGDGAVRDGRQKTDAPVGLIP